MPNVIGGTFTFGALSRAPRRQNPVGLRAPKQEVREPLTQGGDAFWSATVEPGRQCGWTMDELVQLIQQELGDLDGPFIAGRMEGIADLVRQTPPASRGSARNGAQGWLPRR
jgi:hypothetical protein